MIAPLAGLTPTKPSFATLPLPGVDLILVDQQGNELLGNDVEGNLCLKRPNPGMVRTTFGDHERFKQAYFSTYPGLYFTGDGAKRDADGDYRILGRVDDVINVSGHRIGTAEVEDAICQHFMVNEAAVVGMQHEIKGQGIYAFVIKDQECTLTDTQLRQEIAATVATHIGGIAKPDVIQFVSGLPKTRSGKIMRRILRKVIERDLANLGDTSTLLDPTVVDALVAGNKSLLG
jgi:acetyl-CoA synthetase